MNIQKLDNILIAIRSEYEERKIALHEGQCSFEDLEEFRRHIEKIESIVERVKSAVIR